MGRGSKNGVKCCPRGTSSSSSSSYSQSEETSITDSSSSSGEEWSCQACPDGMPPAFLVTLSGVTDATCSNCSAMNGTYLLLPTGIPNQNRTNCTYQLFIPQALTPCWLSGSGVINLVIGQTTLNVQWRDSTGTGLGICFRLTKSAGDNCFYDTDVPVIVCPAPGNGCNTSSAVCHITAIT